MPDQKPVIVDTNILFSALLGKKSRFAQFILDSDRDFFIGESIVAELFKQKERIVNHSNLSEEGVIRLFYTLMRRVDLHKEELIDREVRREAYEACASTDPSDAPHVGLTLYLDGLLWTGDQKLKKELRKKGYDFFFEPQW